MALHFVQESTVKPVLSDHIKQDIFFFFFRQVVASCYMKVVQKGLPAGAFSRSFLHYFHSAISNHLSITISMSTEWMVA